MSEYTPTPWEVYTVKDQYPGIEALNGTFSIVVWGDSKIEPDCGVQGRTPEEANANAEFIVRAVNSHEALVEALGLVADRIGNLMQAMQMSLPSSIHLEGIRGSLPEIEKQIRAALELAGVEP